MSEFEFKEGDRVRFASRPTFGGADATVMQCPADWETGVYRVRRYLRSEGTVHISFPRAGGDGASFDGSCLLVLPAGPADSSPEAVAAWLMQ